MGKKVRCRKVLSKLYDRCSKAHVGDVCPYVRHQFAFMRRSALHAKCLSPLSLNAFLLQWFVS